MTIKWMNGAKDIAYRGFMVRFSPFREGCWIERDGTFIGYAESLDDAKRQIDEIAG